MTNWNEAGIMFGILLIQWVLLGFYGRLMAKRGYKVALSHVDDALRLEDKLFLKGKPSRTPREIVQELTRDIQKSEKQIRKETARLRELMDRARESKAFGDPPEMQLAILNEYAEVKSKRSMN